MRGSFTSISMDWGLLAPEHQALENGRLGIWCWFIPRKRSNNGNHRQRSCASNTGKRRWVTDRAQQELDRHRQYEAETKAANNTQC